MSYKNGLHSYFLGDFNEYFGPQITVGDYTSVAEGVIWCGSMNHVCIKHPEAVSTYNFNERWKLDYFEPGGISRGPITVGNDVWIGRDSFIIDGVTIGDGVIIGAKSVVGKNIPPYAVAVGNPIQIKRYRFTPEQIKALLRIKWWEWPEELIRERIADFRDITVFVNKYDISN